MEANNPHGEKEICKCESPDSKSSSDEADSASSSVSSPPSTTAKDRKPRLSLTSLGLNLRRGRSLNFTTKRSKKPASTEPKSKKLSKWATITKLNCSKKEQRVVAATTSAAATVPDNSSSVCCQCTCYRSTGEHHLGAGVVFNVEPKRDVGKMDSEKEESSRVESVPNETQETAASSSETAETNRRRSATEEQLEAFNRGVYSSNSTGNIIITTPFMDLNWRRSIHEDCDEAARLQREREMERGVEPPANFRPLRRMQLLCANPDTEGVRRVQLVCPRDLTVNSLCAFLSQHRITLRSCPLDAVAGCHTQVDFIHCLVPDLLNISNCSFYWGKMDRYEAERLLDGRPEGTFLLRDSAQEEFLFSVSFRKYGRSLHARIEQWNHRFSFDSHDPGVYTSDTVCGLIEHYKDPSSCMFFEPMLTAPLHRNFAFSLQHICRAVIISKLNYDDINLLQLPKSLKAYLKEYHYRQKVRVERFEDDLHWLDFRNVSL